MSVVSAHTHRLLTDKAQFFEKSLAALIAFAVLTASSHVAVPVGPVPMTMQTLAVTLTGVFLGPRFGAAVVAFWVAAGFSGLPIFAMGNGGIAALTGPTAGFLYSFPVIAAMAGWLAGKGGILRTFSAMLVANLACLVIGSTWLTVVLAMPVAKAFAVGAAPFGLGAFLKSVLGALLVKASERLH